MGRYLASAPVDSTGRRILAASLLALLVAGPVILAYTDLDPGVIIYGCAVIAVGWLTLFRMWHRRSWLAFSGVPGPRARDHFE